MSPLASTRTRSTKRQPRKPIPTHALRRRLEGLEDRTVPSGFNFINFSAPAGLTLLGDASISADARLRLNPAASNQRGAAWYSAEKQYVAEGFATTFRFQKTSPAGSEGMTFAIQNSSPSFLGPEGPTIGYNGLGNSVVVEFDTYQNADVSDPSASHISVHTGGVGPNSINETFSLGSYATNPVMDDGSVHTARITYAAGTLAVYLDNLTTPVLTVALDLADTLALDSGRAWVGFTASTGGGTQIQDVLDWQFATPTPPATAVWIGDVSQVEGNSGTATFTFTVSRAGDTSGATTVNWATVPGTASAGSDYVAASGQAAFAAGETSVPISVVVNGDAAVEAHETFSVQLSNASGGTIIDARGIGTILNDETTIVVADASVTEGASGYTFLDTFVTASSGGLFHGRSIAFGPDGNLYVGHLGGAFVPRFDGATGKYIDVFANGLGDGAESAQVLFHNGYLFVASSPNVLRFDGVTGAPLPAPGKAGARFATLGDQGVFKGIHAFAFGPDGNLYIPNTLGHDILKYDGSTGTYLGVFVASGSGGLTMPNGLTFGPDGHLYVGTNRSGPDAVYRFQGPFGANPGAYVNTFVASGSGGLDRVPTAGIGFRPDGDLYVTSGDTHSVLRFNGSTGAFVEAVVVPGAGGLNQGGGLTFDSAGLLYVQSQFTNEVLRYRPAGVAAFTVTLAQPSAVPVTVNYTTADGTATAGSDYTAASGTLTFAPGQTRLTIFVPVLDDGTGEPSETFTVTLSDAVGATIADGQGVATIADDDSTKFFVVNDGSPDRTYRYGTPGNSLGNSALNSGNTAPRGAASTVTGTTVWIVDANKTVYVYNASGGLLGSWAAGGIHAQAQVEGIATNGTDVWVLDNKQDKVFRYAGAAGRTSGSQNAASSFTLNSGNANPKGIVTDGTYLWVVNDATTDKVFKYTLAGVLLGSWTIDAANASPTGLTIDPANVSDIWIVDNGTDKVYQYTAAAGRNSGSQIAGATFALAAGNTNPQDIADPPPAITIDNAVATEGSAALRFIDRFVAEGSGGIIHPSALLFGPDANQDGAPDLYVSGTTSDAVHRYDGRTGAFIDTFVTPGSGGLNGPFDLAVGPDGNLYLSSGEINQVLRYSGSSGAFLDIVAGGLSTPQGLMFGPDGSLYIANQFAHEVLRYQNGTLGAFVTAGSGGLMRPRESEFGPDGNGDGVPDLYVVSTGAGRVFRYDGLTGAYIDTFATPPAGVPGSFPNRGIAWLQFGTDGYLYTTARTTADGFDTSIVRYNAVTGAFVDTFNLGRDGHSFILGPDGLVYDSTNSGDNFSFVERFGHASLAAFTVRLDAPSATPVTVTYSTANGTALAGSDYVAASGTLTFAPGQTTRTILVRTLNDAVAEPAESFVVTLSNAVGATIADGQGVATVTDDDPPALRVASATVNGGAAQRSRVTQLAVTFSGVATLPANPAAAFRLTRIGGGPVGGFTATAAVVNGVTVVTLTNFTGAETVGGSLADGRYALTVVANQLPNFDGNGDGAAGDDYVLHGTALNGLFRYYGDIDGDGDVDGSDLVLYVPTLFNAGNYNPAFDFDGDGDVDGSDIVEFVANLFVPLP